MIRRSGAETTKKVVQGWVRNLAKPVFTSDSLLLKAIDRGDCHVGIANTYYLARLLKKDEVKNVNVSGVGIVKASKKQKMAKDFVEWLVTPEAQKLFAELNDEYPVLAGVNWSKQLTQWGKFKQDSTSLHGLPELQKQAVRLMDEAKYR